MTRLAAVRPAEAAVVTAMAAAATVVAAAMAGAVAAVAVTDPVLAADPAPARTADPDLLFPALTRRRP